MLEVSGEALTEYARAEKRGGIYIAVALFGLIGERMLRVEGYTTYFF